MSNAPPQYQALSSLFLVTLHTLRTHWAYPSPHRFTLQTNARPMKPFIWTAIVVAGHHIAITNALARTVLPIISSFIIITFAHIHIFAVSRWWWRNSFIVLVDRSGIRLAD